MSKWKRVNSFLIGLIMLVCAALMIRFPRGGYQFVSDFLCLSLILYAIRKILFFITMARHMLGGDLILYKGLIALDMGLFLKSLQELPQVYVMLYLIAGLFFNGLVCVMRARESRRMGSGIWKRKMTEGMFNIGISAASFFFLRSVRMAVYIYSIGLIYSALSRITDAFRRSAIVYIQ